MPCFLTNNLILLLYYFFLLWGIFFFFYCRVCLLSPAFVSILIVLHFIFQEIHAPILSLWGVKIVVISAFVAFTLASIVSTSSLTIFWLAFFICILFVLPKAEHELLNCRHFAPGLSLVWNKRLFFLKIHISRSDFDAVHFLGLYSANITFLNGSVLYPISCRGISTMLQSISESDLPCTLWLRTITTGITIIQLCIWFSH